MSCSKSSFLVLCTKVMFIIYQRQGFVSGQNPQGVTIQNRENLSIHNAKKRKKTSDSLPYFCSLWQSATMEGKFSNECRENDETRGPSQGDIHKSHPIIWPIFNRSTYPTKYSYLILSLMTYNFRVVTIWCYQNPIPD